MLEVCQNTCGACEGDIQQGTTSEREEKSDKKSDDDKESKSYVKEEKEKDSAKEANVSGQVDPCSDEYDKGSCEIWRDSGFCSNNQSVRKWCRLTCGVCERVCQDTLPASTCRAAIRYMSNTLWNSV